MAVPELSISANMMPSRPRSSARCTPPARGVKRLGWILGNGMNWKRMNKGKVTEKFSLKAGFAGKIAMLKLGCAALGGKAWFH